MCRRMRPHAPTGLLLSCCLLAGCGDGGAQATSQASRSLIPAGVGAVLAARADALSTALAGPDPCAAMPQIQRFQQAVGAAVTAGQVPTRLEAPLLKATASLGTSVTCPAKPAGPPKKDDHGPQHKRHRPGDSNGQGDGGD
jgi:hypothetical protein